VKVGTKVVFNYIDQARMQLDYSGTVMDQVCDKNEIVQFGDQRLSARSYLRRFLFEGERVRSASIACPAANALASCWRRSLPWRQRDRARRPTNDLDLPSLRMLEEALADFNGTVIVVSHDRYFLDRICDQIVAFEDGRTYSFNRAITPTTWRNEKTARRATSSSRRNSPRESPRPRPRPRPSQ